jgi:hypothetical protein
MWAVCTVGGVGVLVAVIRLPKTPLPQPAAAPATRGAPLVR